MNHAIRVVAILQAKPGKEAELEAVLKAAVVPSRAEAGCREYTLHVDRENTGRFVFVERWIDMAAIQRHRENPNTIGRWGLRPSIWCRTSRSCCWMKCPDSN